MKVQIDTKAKTLKIENDIVLSELVEFLDKILPGEWKSYKLETNTIIHKWKQPIVIERNPYWIEPYRWNQPYYTICGSVATGTGEGVSSMLGSGVYNLEVN